MVEWRKQIVQNLIFVWEYMGAYRGKLSESGLFPSRTHRTGKGAVNWGLCKKRRRDFHRLCRIFYILCNEVSKWNQPLTFSNKKTVDFS